jgi:acetyl-CoA carboxylase biotin carboxyl carrier protein
MEFDQIKELIALLQDTSIGEFLYEKDGVKVRIRTKDFGKTAAPAAPIFAPMPNFMAAPAQSFAPQAPASQEAAPQVKTETKAEEPKQQEAPKSTANYKEIKSPMVGTFYRSSSPDKPPFVKVGDIISPKDTICLIEAMKLFNEVKAEMAGRVVKVMADDASPVEYDQVLFLIEPL